jgi:hypothetical protein
LGLVVSGGARWGRSRGAGAGAGDEAERGGRALLRAGAWTEGARSARKCLRRAKGRREAAKTAAAAQRLGRAGSQSASWMARSAVVAIKEGRWSHVERAGGSAGLAEGDKSRSQLPAPSTLTHTRPLARSTMQRCHGRGTATSAVLGRRLRTYLEAAARGQLR